MAFHRTTFFAAPGVSVLRKRKIAPFAESQVWQRTGRVDLYVEIVTTKAHRLIFFGTFFIDMPKHAISDDLCCVGNDHSEVNTDAAKQNTGNGNDGGD